MGYYAHTKDGLPEETWQQLQEHLKNTARRAGAFASAFQSGDLALLGGLLHDVGKYSPEFQRRLQGESTPVDHSTAGGQLALARLSGLGYLLAYGLMGHHTGLPNAGSINQCGSLSDRLQRTVADYAGYQEEITISAEKLGLPWPPGKRPGFSYSTLIRMLFSCIVDADRLDTEQFYDLDRSLRRGLAPSLQKLSVKMDDYMNQFTENAVDSRVNRERAHVLSCCRRAADLPQGIFTLTVPTGGGKTLSSLEFALRHAMRHGLKRVIYVIPFTSIIEQTAQKFRDVLGDEAVLEHHSNFAFAEGDNLALSLATENWDAPVIVTTNVQFFESLFSDRPSRCRKLHNIAESVVILDEAQAIPDEYLKPCLAALEELCAHYQVSAVLCTATQPELTGQWPMNSSPREIIPDPERLYNSLRRVQVSYLGTVTDLAVVDLMRQETQALCVVNTRKSALQIFQSLGKTDGHYHLSARMHPVHRARKLTEIKQRLSAGDTCRVVSTQLVEAGVDVDFPLVLRAVAGIDSIAQAAGRCNREGKLPMGRAFVFNPENGVPRGWFRRMAELGKRIMEETDDPLSLEAVRRFFSRRFDLGSNGLDKHGILPELEAEWKTLSFQFKDLAEKFRLIDDSSQAIVIPDQAIEDLLVEVDRSKYPGMYSRRLQRYTVGIYPQEFEQYLRQGWLRLVGGVYYVLDYPAGYDDAVGLLSIDDFTTI